MIRSYYFDTEKDWDEIIHLLLFAVRESVQKSLGFSPFDLVFGQTVHGPLTFLKKKFLSNDVSSLNLLQCVSDFKDRLSKACEAARTDLTSAQRKMKPVKQHPYRMNPIKQNISGKKFSICRTMILLNQANVNGVLVFLYQYRMGHIACVPIIEMSTI